MKKIFISLLAVVALAACNKSEVVDVNPGEAIQFGNAFVDNATKADYSSTDINSFKVYGTVNDVNIYNATPVTKSAEYGDAWKCDLTQYWIKDAAYKFAALVDVPDTNVTTDTKGMPVSFTYTADNQTDILYDYALATGNEAGKNSIVAFTFQHLLAKAYFTVTNLTNDTKYTYTVSTVNVTNTYPNGTYTVYTTDGGTGSWGSFGTATSTAFATIENVAFETPKTNAELLLIPGATVGVSFTVTLSIDGKVVTSFDHSLENVATLAQNSVYNFNVTLSPNDPILFTVTTQPEWNEVSDNTVTVSK